MYGQLRITELAERVGVSATTIRYYERIGLLPEPPRSTNGYRAYGSDTIERFRFIACAKELGCTLREIEALLAPGQATLVDRLRETIEAKRREVERERAALDARLACLRSAADKLEDAIPTSLTAPRPAAVVVAA